MSSEVEDIARREAAEMEDPNTIRVRVPVAWEGPLCLPRADGDKVEEAVFKVMTFGDNLVVERACRMEKDDNGRKYVEMDYNEMRRLTIKRNLIGWTLDVPLERENG